MTKIRNRGSYELFMNEFIAPVPLEKAYRLINHGPTVLVSARHGGVDDVMAAAWACALDMTTRLAAAAKVVIVSVAITAVPNDRRAAPRASPIR